MHKKIKHLINQFKEDTALLDSIIVTLFIKSNFIKVTHNALIKSLLIPEDFHIKEFIADSDFRFSFDDMIEAFELAIPRSEKIINGAVYTPNYIKNFIVEHALTKVTKTHHSILVADIACGCGAFLFTIAVKLRVETGMTFYKIYKDNIYGLDICERSINRTKILLSILALVNGEDKREFKFNLHCANALSFDWYKIEERIRANKGFDLIVGNPPYVRAKNLDQKTKSLLPQWEVTKTGNPDLYIPFFEIGVDLVNETGLIGYITVNSFYRSVNARALRKYLQTKSFDIIVIDFGNEKIFSNKSVYTCICFISKESSKTIAFKKETSKTLTKNKLEHLSHIPYTDLNYHKGWLLNDKRVIKNIKRIERTGKPLGDTFRIKNGIATLSNDIYIFKPLIEKRDYYVFTKNGKQYDIEKGICRDIIKPNILKHESEIESVKEKLIFPYYSCNNTIKVINEKDFQSSFPKAYKYLLENIEKLQKRDKGKGDYVAWYAFGRTQALCDFGVKLLFPYMAKTPHFVFTNQKDMFIYCGYAIFSNSENDLRILKRILESKVFEYYMINTSKPYSAGYFSYAKNYVKNFGICELNEAERQFISNGTTKKEIDELLLKKYNLLIK